MCCTVALDPIKFDETIHVRGFLDYFLYVVQCALRVGEAGKDNSMPIRHVCYVSFGYRGFVTSLLATLPQSVRY